MKVRKKEVFDARIFDPNDEEHSDAEDIDIPNYPNSCMCPRCARTYHVHGHMYTVDGGNKIICPGDYIINLGLNAITLHPEEFHELYEILE